MKMRINFRCHKSTLFTRCSDGMTLIEIMATVMIISILAAIIFAVQSQAIRKAKEAGCLSNIHSASIGLLAYTAENNQKFPYCFVNSTRTFWADPIFTQGYVPSLDVFFCPANDTKYWKNRPVPGAYVSYGASRYGLMPNDSDGRKQVALGAIAQPSKMVMLVETANTAQKAKDGSDGLYWTTSGDVTALKQLFVSNQPTTAVRHQKTINASFVDGHVQAFDIVTGDLSNFSVSTAPPWYEMVYEK